jgi:membrane protease YdiL (CAAX protease family)
MESPSAAPRSAGWTLKYVFFNDRGLRAGWRLVIFVMLAAVTSFMAVSVMRLLGAGVRARRGSAATASPLWLGLDEMSQFSAIAISTWIMSLIERRPARVYGLPLTKTALSRFAVGYVIWGFLPLTTVLLIMRALGVFRFGSLAIHGGEILYWGAAWGFVFLAVALWEEYLCRGYTLYTLAEGIGFWPAAIVLGVVFAATHLSNPGEGPLGIIDAFIFALFAAATLRRTGTLWLAVGAHAGWDWGESFFYGVSNSGLQFPGHLLNPQVQGPDWLTGGSVGPEGSVVDLLVWTLLTVGVLFFYRPPQPSPQIDTAMSGSNNPFVANP